MKTGLELIAEERQRQIDVEGWDSDHDDHYHYNGELYEAGRCYQNGMADGWPWDEDSFKPSGMVMNRIKAGALFQAEIDRLERLKADMGKEIDLLTK